MIDFIICFFGVVFFCFLFEPLIINFVYFFNLDLFFDIILLKKKRDKLIKYVFDNYYIDDWGLIYDKNDGD